MQGRGSSARVKETLDRYFDKIESRISIKWIQMITDVMFAIGIIIVILIYFKIFATNWIIIYIVIVGLPIIYYILRFIGKRSRVKYF